MPSVFRRAVSALAPAAAAAERPMLLRLLRRPVRATWHSGQHRSFVGNGLAARAAAPFCQHVEPARRLPAASILHAGLPRGAASRSGRNDVEGGDDELDETRFHTLADSMLEGIHNIIDSADLDCMDDIIFEDGVLKLEVLNGGTFVINKHFVTRQIWYASPISGALYFSPSGDGIWTTTLRSGDTSDLVSVLREDLGVAVPAGEIPEKVMEDLGAWRSEF